jgi:undecaprenyl-diphosphatase
MSPFDAIWLGVIEGLTEFLPVSSTGHLILLGQLLGSSGEAAKAIDIVIQLGAILAAAVYFRVKLLDLARGLVRREPASLRLVAVLLAAFVPTAVVGLLAHHWIEAHLFGPIPVAEALIVGGVVMIAVEVARRRTGRLGVEGLEHATLRTGLIVGLAQCLALWPGASRSMVTIVAGQLCGLRTKTAAELSFLLAIPTLGAATVFDFAKSYREIGAVPNGMLTVAVGLGVSFVVAWLVIAAFLRYLSRFGLAPFGWYRIALGALVLVLALR